MEAARRDAIAAATPRCRTTRRRSPSSFGAGSSHVAQQYPLSRYANSALAFSAAMTDGVFACRAGQMEAGLMPNSPVYAYEFNDREAPGPAPLRAVPFPVGAAHSLELRYLFDIRGAPTFSAAQQELPDRMIGYWTGFVPTGVPTPTTHRIGPTRRDGPWMSLQTPEVRTFADFADDHHCAFWASRSVRVRRARAAALRGTMPASQSSDVTRTTIQPRSVRISMRRMSFVELTTVGSVVVAFVLDGYQDVFHPYRGRRSAGRIRRRQRSASAVWEIRHA